MDEQFLNASQEYLQHRHEIALRLLAECDRQVSATDRAEEDQLRDRAMLALVKRDYLAAASVTQELATHHAQREHLLFRQRQLRQECDKLCSARSTLDQRQLLLEQVPSSIDDPYMGEVSTYLQKRHETALRLLAAVDMEIAKISHGCSENDKQQLEALQIKREQMTIEVDTLLAAMQVQEQREELLHSAGGSSAAADTAVYLRRVLAYLDARSGVVLKLIASIDQQLASGTADALTSSRLKAQRANLVAELDDINEKVAVQKRGEAELQECGLRSDTDPFLRKVTGYLQTRSDVALQVIAYLDQQLDKLSPDAPDCERLAGQREALRREADAALAQIGEQERFQELVDSLQVGSKSANPLA